MTSFIEKLSRLYPKSLISEVSKILGKTSTEHFLTVFGGMKVKVPSHEDIAKMKRNLEIYEALAHAKATTNSRSQFRIVRRTIQAKFGIKKKKAMSIYAQMDKLLKVSAEVKAIDVAVGLHKRLKKKRKR